MTIMIRHNKPNTIPILFKNGTVGSKNLKAKESGIDKTVAVKALFAVALFQNNPNKKIAVIPGLIKPVNS